MYRYQYKNKRSGAAVFSHRPIERDNLELVREFQTNELTPRNTKMNDAQTFTKSEVFTKPKVITLKRK